MVKVQQKGPIQGVKSLRKFWEEIAKNSCPGQIKNPLSVKSGVGLVVEDGETQLHLAAENGHTETVKALLDRGASINLLDRDGYTALHLAAESGHTETVKALLDRGASVNQVEKKIGPHYI